MSPPESAMVSANTLFHFTSSFENLENILRTKFSPRFCLENFSPLLNRSDNAEFAIPMVCFCDLPLSRTEAHLATYGRYGIGLTKEWGRRNGVTPVLYVHPESPLYQNLSSLIGQLRTRALTASADGAGSLLSDVLEVVCYMKPYEGPFYRGGTYKEGVRFYNEREWRYVPPRDKRVYAKGISRTEFENEEGRASLNAELASLVSLGFGPDDIRYVLVSTEDEIPKTMDLMEKVFSASGSYLSVKRLLTRILSVEYLHADF